MRKLGKKIGVAKNTVQAYSPCGNGCLCRSCSSASCTCLIFLDSYYNYSAGVDVLTMNNYNNDMADHN